MEVERLWVSWAKESVLVFEKKQAYVEEMRMMVVENQEVVKGACYMLCRCCLPLAVTGRSGTTTRHAHTRRCRRWQISLCMSSSSVFRTAPEERKAWAMAASASLNEEGEPLGKTRAFASKPLGVPRREATLNSRSSTRQLVQCATLCMRDCEEAPQQLRDSQLPSHFECGECSHCESRRRRQ